MIPSWRPAPAGRAIRVFSFTRGHPQQEDLLTAVRGVEYVCHPVGVPPLVGEETVFKIASERGATGRADRGIGFPTAISLEQGPDPLVAAGVAVDAPGWFPYDAGTHGPFLRRPRE